MDKNVIITGMLGLNTLYAMMYLFFIPLTRLEAFLGELLILQ